MRRDLERALSRLDYVQRHLQAPRAYVQRWAEIETARELLAAALQRTHEDLPCYHKPYSRRKARAL